MSKVKSISASAKKSTVTRLSSLAPQTHGLSAGERCAYASAAALGIKNPSPEMIAEFARNLYIKHRLTEEQIEELMTVSVGHGRVEDLADYETHPHFRKHRQQRQRKRELASRDSVRKMVAGETNVEARKVLDGSLPLLRRLAANGCTLSAVGEA